MAALERHGAPIALWSIISSRGDTLTEAEVLEALEIYNQAEAIMEVDQGMQ